MSLLALLHSKHTGSLHISTVTSAFAPPQPAATGFLRTRSRAHPLRALKADDGGKGLQPFVNSNAPIPIGSNKPLVRLTPQQEAHLLRRMHSHPAHTSLSQIARQTLLMHNLPLVHSIVTKILRSRPHLVRPARSGRKGSPTTATTSHDGASQVGAALTRDDLIHEGVVGLAEAIDRYDLAYITVGDEGPPTDPTSPGAAPTFSPRSSSNLPKGARLGTYATYWIRARVLRAIQSREHFVRFPEHALLASHRLVRAARDMGLEWQYVVDELADYGVISVGRERLRERLRMAAGIKSDGLFREAVRIRTMSRAGAVTPLEPWMTPSAPSAASHAGAADDELASEAGQEHILDTLSKFLVPREVEVLRLRYGLVSSEEEESLEEVADCSKDVAASQLRSVRDYQAEAEDELFGPEGMLSHYAAASHEGIAAVTTASSSTTKLDISSFESMPSSVSPLKTDPDATTRKVLSPTLLPFTEIGKRMKFSGEYCRRTCAQAVNKLKRAAEEGRLAESDISLGW